MQEGVMELAEDLDLIDLGAMLGILSGRLEDYLLTD